ncbi:MAG: NAD-dependent epimerase/dehydratase family protein [Pseudomonadota bacterium]
MKTAIVLSAGGFIGDHLLKYLKKDGFWGRGVDVKFHEHAETEADNSVIGDLREQDFVRSVINRCYDEVYQLATE